MKLESFEIEHFRNLVGKNQITETEIISYLEEKGLSENEITNTLNSINKNLTKTTNTSHKDFDLTHLGFVLMSAVGVATVLFSLKSKLWLGISVTLIATLGYTLNEGNRIIGAISAILFFITLQLVIPFYIENRDSIYHLELIFIALICWVPAILVFMLLQYIFKK